MKCSVAVLTVLLFAAPMFAETERVLLPIFSPPVFGAHGSQFHTELYIGNPSPTPVTIRNLEEICKGACPGIPLPEGPFELRPGQQSRRMTSSRPASLGGS